MGAILYGKLNHIVHTHMFTNLSGTLTSTETELFTKILGHFGSSINPHMYIQYLKCIVQKIIPYFVVSLAVIFTIYTSTLFCHYDYHDVAHPSLKVIFSAYY